MPQLLCLIVILCFWPLVFGAVEDYQYEEYDNKDMVNNYFLVSLNVDYY